MRNLVDREVSWRDRPGSSRMIRGVPAAAGEIRGA